VPLSDAAPMMGNVQVLYRADGLSNVAEPDYPGAPAIQDHFVQDRSASVIDRFRLAREREYGSQWVPYRRRGDSLEVWEGLVNEHRSARVLEFIGPDEHRLTLPDGSMAYYRRISRDPSNYVRPAFQCVPQTTRGGGDLPYDESRSQRILAELRRSTGASSTLRDSLVGTWVSESSQGSGLYLMFRFGKDGSLAQSPTRDSDGKDLAWHAAAKGRYWLTSSMVLLSASECGEWLPFQLTEDRLVLDLGMRESSAKVSFRRVRAD